MSYEPRDPMYPVGVLKAAIKRIQIVQTPTGPFSITRPVAESLLKEGVITGELDKELKAHDVATVKAAIMAGAGVCDFCSSPGATNEFNVHDFAMPGMDDGLESTGGWAACDPCAALVRAGRKKDLLQRSIDTAAFPKFTRPALAELHESFWKALKINEALERLRDMIIATAEGKIPPEVPLHAVYNSKPRRERCEAVQRRFGFTDDEMGRILMRETLTPAIVKKMGKFGVDAATSVADAYTLVHELVKPAAPARPDQIPHWQRAIDAKLVAYTGLARMLDECHPELLNTLDERARKKMHERRKLAEMGFMDDLRWLRDAQVYSFNSETIASIREASQYVPNDTPLSAVDFPEQGAGWFFFAEPLPLVASSIVANEVHALLWGWEHVESEEITFTLDDEWVDKLGPKVQERLTNLPLNDDTVSYNVTKHDINWLGMALKDAGMSQADFDASVKRTPRADTNPALVFSAYVVDARGQYLSKGSVSPSTRFYWRFTDTLDEMLAKNGHAWDISYGPGSEDALSGNPPAVHNRAETLKTVEQLARFFATASSWFKQRVPILTATPAHIERHARKRMMKEHNLTEPPKVQIVALRRSERVARADAPSDRQEGAREYSCRWIVRRHPRLQPYGPGRKEKRLIWIEAHPAGPPDKPLRTRERVYAVIR